MDNTKTVTATFDTKDNPPSIYTFRNIFNGTCQDICNDNGGKSCLGISTVGGPGSNLSSMNGIDINPPMLWHLPMIKYNMRVITPDENMIIIIHTDFRNHSG